MKSPPLETDNRKTIYLKAYKRNIERWDMYEVFEEENCISFGECS